MLFLMQVVQRPYVLTVADLFNIKGRNLKISINTMGQRHDIDTRELNCAAKFHSVFLNDSLLSGLNLANTITGTLQAPWSCYHRLHRELVLPSESS